MRTEHSFIETFSFGHINETRSLYIFTESYSMGINETISDNISLNDTFSIEENRQ